MHPAYYHQRHVRADQTVIFNGLRYPASLDVGSVALVLPIPGSNAITLKAANRPDTQQQIHPI